MASTGLIPKILEKIGNARRPERFTQDFLETKLGHSGGNARAIIPLLKRMNFIGSDGVPTELYDKFRNTETQGAAVAAGIRNAYSELFEINEYAYDLPRDKLLGVVLQITGGAKDDRTTKAIISTFWALKELADFEADLNKNVDRYTQSEGSPTVQGRDTEEKHHVPVADESDNVQLRVGYTINLNLPETSDPEVFNAIFRALKEHLLKNQ